LSHHHGPGDRELAAGLLRPVTPSRTRPTTSLAGAIELRAIDWDAEGETLGRPRAEIVIRQDVVRSGQAQVALRICIRLGQSAVTCWL
jgi:hypothetical protein